MQIVVGIFLVLHGLVHLIYLGQSAKLFQLQPGLNWPDGSWAFSRLLGDGPARSLAIVTCLLAAMAFVSGGAALMASQQWWRPVVAAAAGLSTMIFVLFWDGQIHALPDKGLFAIVINLAIVVVFLIFRWPRLV